jgi:chorismate synthase
LRYLTAGQSHGEEIVVIIDGFPSKVKISLDFVNNELYRRSLGYGRGERMKIQRDNAQFISGVRGGYTTGSPICAKLRNPEWGKWSAILDPFKEIDVNKVTIPRPGHADLPGILKFGLRDIRDVMERASARETASRVLAGALAKIGLSDMDIQISSHVVQIGNVSIGSYDMNSVNNELSDSSLTRCIDKEVTKKMINEIEKAKLKGDSVGGIFEVIVKNLAAGIGSFTQWDLKLDARIARAIVSIQGIKGVEFGTGFGSAKICGSDYHDQIYWREDIGYFRNSNNVGGFEGGMTNGENLVIRAVMKPIPTLLKPLNSVDIADHLNVKAHVERSDVCAVPAAAVVAEAVTAIEVISAIQEMFGKDNFDIIKNSYAYYRDAIKKK